MATNDRGLVFPGDESLYSNEFQLIRDLGIVSVVGLADGDTASFEVRVGRECEYTWIPFAPTCCGQISVDNGKTQELLALPNTYRIILSNVDGNHLTDPAWFENVQIYYQIVESDLDLSAYLKGDSCMGCGISVSDVIAIVEQAQANAACACGDELALVDADITALETRVLTLEGSSANSLTSTVTVAGGVVTFTLGDGSTVDVDVTTDAELAAALAALPADEFVTTNTVTGSTVNLFTNQGNPAGSFDLPGVVDNGDGTLTITPVGGTPVTVAVGADDQVVASADGSVTIVPTVGAGGQIDYDLSVSADASALTATDPTGSGGTSVQDVLDNLQAEITAVAGADVAVDTISVVASGPSNSLVTLTMTDGSTRSFTTVDGDVDTTNAVVSGVMVGNDLVLTLGDGSTVTADLSSVVGAGDTNTTNVSLGVIDGDLIITDSDGNIVTYPLNALPGNLNGITASVVGTVLTLTDPDGVTVSQDLASIDTDTTVTNASASVSGTSLTITDSVGGTVVVDLASAIAAGSGDDFLASLALAGNVLTATLNGGGTVPINLTPLVNTAGAAGVAGFTQAGNILTITTSDGTTFPLDLTTLLAASDTNTTNVSMVLDAANNLTVTDSDGNTVVADLSQYEDDDDQIASATPPVAPSLGDVWYDTTTDEVFMFINDGTSTQWIQISADGAGTISTANIAQATVAGTDTLGNPINIGDWVLTLDNGDTRNYNAASSSVTYTAAATAPASPTLLDQWYDTTADVLFQYINDGTSSFWREI